MYSTQRASEECAISGLLEPADIRCAKVLDMLQTVTRGDNVSIVTTRSSLRVDGKRTRTSRAAPLVGEQSGKIRTEFSR
jgi:crotonobetainyl-CoA:carnitine CoA-transferase CaiB-like acyl-CoA transferase